MPLLTPEEIKVRIADGAISAISIDTNVFDRYGCNLTFPVLRRLDQFAGGNIAVLISEVVEREVKRHIAEAAGETQRALKKALKEQGKRWAIPTASMAAAAAYRAVDAPEDVAAEQYLAFANAVSAERVAALGLNDRTGEILDRYFGARPPFESREAKKNEFPDAFALLSLEAHAVRAGTQVLCVSADKGWMSFCETSASLICMADIEAALALFNDAGRVVADRAIGRLRLGDDPHLVAAVEAALGTRLDDADFDADGWSSLSFDTEPSFAVLQQTDWPSATPPKVIAADEDAVTFTTTITARVLFEATFNFVVRDSIDRDWLNLASETVATDSDIDFELVITVPRDEGAGYEEVEVEVARRRIEVNFGTVEPFQSEDPTHERY